MSQYVPSWDLDLDHHLLHHRAPLPSSAATRAADTPAEYDVMELTWNHVGHLATLGLRKPIPRNPSSTAAAASTAAAERNSDGGGGGTLECIVDQACSGAHHPACDATVPCSDPPARKQNGVFGANSTSQGSAAPTVGVAKRKSMSSPPPPPLPGNEGEEVRCGGGGGGGSPEVENVSVAGRWPLEADENGNISRALRSRRGDGLGERGIASISAKRSREAAVHNQSERKRRDRINQKMKALQKLLPKSNKTDKASMLDEVIEYLKLLQAQVQMMSRIPSMMLPIAMQHQQLQLSMMAHLTQISRMSLGLGIMDPSLLNLVPPTPILHPSNFLFPSSLTSASDTGTTKLMQEPYRRILPDMIPAFMGCPTQQQAMSSEAYSRLAALYQQLYQQRLGSNQKT